MRIRPFLLTPLAVAALAAGCGGSSDAQDDGAPRLSLVAYSTPQVVYDELIPTYQRTEAGAGTALRTSFGPSGDQSRAVEAGLDADVVSFSIERDMSRVK